MITLAGEGYIARVPGAPKFDSTGAVYYEVLVGIKRIVPRRDAEGKYLKNSGAHAVFEEVSMLCNAKVSENVIKGKSLELKTPIYFSTRQVQFKTSWRSHARNEWRKGKEAIGKAIYEGKVTLNDAYVSLELGFLDMVMPLAEQTELEVPWEPPPRAPLLDLDSEVQK